jgi:hypothetical protein
MTVHELKCWPTPFAAMRSGAKRFEYRKDDRNYQVGDILYLNEWNPDDEPVTLGSYTGEGDRYRVTYKLAGRFGVPDGYCVLGVEPLANDDPAQVVVMGKASVAKVRETLHKLANICAWSGKVAGQEIAEQAIALLPLTSTPTEATAGDAVTCRNCNRPVNGEGDLCEKCACRSCGMLNPTGHMCCQPCE